MKYTETAVQGCYVVDLEPRGDDRGFFSRMYCQKEFEAKGLKSHFVQANNSWSAHKGTLRGLHFQRAPHSEAKLVRCLSGALWDLVLDLRQDSATYGKYAAAMLTPENRTMMYVPPGCAHAFLTLEDNTEAFYLVSAFYCPESEGGVRWNDPAFAIPWPLEPTVISDKDKQYANFTSISIPVVP